MAAQFDAGKEDDYGVYDPSQHDVVSASEIHPIIKTGNAENPQGVISVNMDVNRSLIARRTAQAEAAKARYGTETDKVLYPMGGPGDTDINADELVFVEIRREPDPETGCLRVMGGNEPAQVFSSFNGASKQNLFMFIGSARAKVHIGQKNDHRESAAVSSVAVQTGGKGYAPVGGGKDTRAGGRLRVVMPTYVPGEGGRMMSANPVEHQKSPHKLTAHLEPITTAEEGYESYSESVADLLMDRRPPSESAVENSLMGFLQWVSEAQLQLANGAAPPAAGGAAAAAAAQGAYTSEKDFTQKIANIEKKLMEIKDECPRDPESNAAIAAHAAKTLASVGGKKNLDFRSRALGYLMILSSKVHEVWFQNRNKGFCAIANENGKDRFMSVTWKQ